MCLIYVIKSVINLNQITIFNILKFIIIIFLLLYLFIFIVQNEAANNMENINQDRVSLKRCKYLLKQALDIDESGREDLAIDTYTKAIELSLKVVGRTFFLS